MSDRRLIVNADDFGYSEGLNAGVIEAHERGVVTSASLMVHWPAAEGAARYAAGRRGFSLGLHFDLGQWEFVDGEWRTVYERAPRDDGAAVEAELRGQLERFRELTGGEDPSHLDSHQHVHRDEPVAGVALSIAHELGVPLRDRSPIGYCGDFYGQTGEGEPYPEGITVENLVSILRSLPPGVSELGCHPGLGLGDDVYALESEIEVGVLCDPRVRTVLEAEGIELISYRDVAGIRGPLSARR